MNKPTETLSAKEIQRNLKLRHEEAWKNPLDSDAQCELGLAYNYAGKPGLAIRAHKRAIELNPVSIPANFNLGFTYNGLKNYESAAKCFEKVIEIDANFTAAHLMLGTAYGEMGRHEDAISSLHKGLSLEDDNPQVYHSLGKEYGHLERWTEAVESYRIAVERDPLNEDMFNTYLALGMAYERKMRGVSARAMPKAVNGVVGLKQSAGFYFLALAMLALDMEFDARVLQARVRGMDKGMAEELEAFFDEK